MSTISAQELADKLGGVLLHCPPDRPLSEVLPLDEAGPQALSFLSNPKYTEKARFTKAGLVIASSKSNLGELPQLQVPNPYHGFAQALSLLHPEPEPEFAVGPIHRSARIGEGCTIAHGATVGARTVLEPGCVLHPGVHVAEDCVLGEGCVLYPGVVLYRKTRLGKRVRVHANSVLGSDGFGYVAVEGRQIKVPQVGWVEVEDDVEIGACTTVDRGAMGPTRLGKGTKVDNLVQIAHNIRTGEDCVICGQVGLSGSTTLGDRVIFAGRSGSAGHLHVGDQSIVAACAVVAKDVPPGTMVSGFPARPHREWLASQAALNRLPALEKKLKA